MRILIISLMRAGASRGAHSNFSNFIIDNIINNPTVSWIITFISFLLAIISLVYTIKTKKAKYLQWYWEYSCFFNNFDNIIAKKFKTSYNDELVEYLTVYTFSFWNAGNVHIENNDMLNKISFSLPDTAQILDAIILFSSSDRFPDLEYSNGIEYQILEESKKIIITFNNLQSLEGGVLNIITSNSTPENAKVNYLIKNSSISNKANNLHIVRMVSFVLAIMSSIPSIVLQALNTFAQTNFSSTIIAFFTILMIVFLSMFGLLSHLYKAMHNRQALPKEIKEFYNKPFRQM